MIVTLAKAGADVFRLNFSHGAHETHAAVYAAIREAEKVVDRPLGVLADLQGQASRRKIRRRPGDAEARSGVPLRQRSHAGR